VAIRPLDGRIEHRVGGADGLSIARPPPLVVLFQGVEPHASLADEPGCQALDVAALLGYRERVRDEGILQRVEPAVADAARLQTPLPRVPEILGRDAPSGWSWRCSAPAFGSRLRTDL